VPRVITVFPTFGRLRPPVRTFSLSIIARDPTVEDPRSTDPVRRILRTAIDVPASRIEPGPRGPRFQIVDFDSSTRRLRQPRQLTALPDEQLGWGFKDPYDGATDASIQSRAFMAQNTYAIAARLLATFERALGRPVPWAFGSSQLYIVPAAFVEANAYYSPDDRAVLFGYFRVDDQTVYASLSHDIVAHEVTHAILDGLRRRFDTPGFPDQAGFHEGYADAVALLSILSSHESTSVVLGGSMTDRVPVETMTFPNLRGSVLLTLAKQFGDAIHANRGGGLRRSIELNPTTEWKDLSNIEWGEPHRRGEVFVAAVFRAFVRMWLSRLSALLNPAGYDRQRTAEEGATAARHLLEIIIRAIDYLPPIEFELKDILAAIIASDREVAPDDEYGYIKALKDGFADFGIEPPDESTDVPDKAPWPNYRSFSYAALRSDPDEAFRFIWESAAFLSIDPTYFLQVENVRPCLRVGPRGFTIAETVVDYVQELNATRADLEDIAHRDQQAHGRPSSFDMPDDVPADTKIKIWGGGTIVFDEFGGAKYHAAKPLKDWGRQQARLEYLVSRGLWDTKGRLGFSLGIPAGQQFALYHVPSAGGESW
jgi:hypothetical protein